VRFELSTIGVGLLFGDYQFYNVLISAHGLVMIFGFIMPVIMGGFTNYWLPVMIGCPDMIFPRLNNLSFWLYLVGVLFMIFSVTIEEGIGIGWTLYPTLLCIDYHSGGSVDFAIFAVHLLGFSSIVNSLNVVCTVFGIRKKYFSMIYVNLFIWGMMFTSFLLITCLPILAGAVTLVLTDRNFNTSFYDVLGGGDAVLFQHLFWFFGHPEVYIIILPVFGIVSSIIDVISGKSVFSLLAMIYSMSSISLLGFFVWAHHMFTIGMDIDSRAYFGSITLIIGVPTSIKIFNWIFSIFCGIDILVYMESYFVYMFIFMFLMGGITGLLLANVGLDILLHDTYFVVAHFHYVLSLGAVVGFFAYTIHFMCKWIPIEFNSLLFIICFWIIFIGSNLLFGPLHNNGFIYASRLDLIFGF
jgi:heme/copper-type cytochrome/quinol oxidase subunit 1